MLDHHAYYIEDSVTNAGAYAEALRAREGFEKNSAQYIVRAYDVFGIDEARALGAASSIKVGEGMTLFFISASSIPGEAQQALLKLFEEPQAGLVFVLLVPHGTLLPTLRSRFLEYPHKADVAENAPLQKEAKAFLADSYKARSEWLATFLKPARRDDGAGKDEDDDLRAQARDFINALEAELYPRLGSISTEKWEAKRDVREGLADIAHFRQYLSDRSPSLKMIFEHLAATLPVIAKIPEKNDPKKSR